MLVLTTAAALLLAAMTEPVARPGPPPDAEVARAARGLTVQIEYDGRSDTMMKSIRAKGCALSVEGRDWTIDADMRVIEGVGLGDPSFIAIMRNPGVIALVVDGDKTDQREKLGKLNAALTKLYEHCRLWPEKAPETP